MVISIIATFLLLIDLCNLLKLFTNGNFICFLPYLHFAKILWKFFVLILIFLILRCEDIWRWCYKSIPTNLTLFGLSLIDMIGVDSKRCITSHKFFLCLFWMLSCNLEFIVPNRKMIISLVINHFNRGFIDMPTSTRYLLYGLKTDRMMFLSGFSPLLHLFGGIHHITVSSKWLIFTNICLVNGLLYSFIHVRLRIYSIFFLLGLCDYPNFSRVI